MPEIKRILRPAALAMILGLIGGPFGGPLCGSLAPAWGQVSGDPASRAEFEAICTTLHDGENLYFGHRIVGEIEQRVERATDPLVSLLLRDRLAHELMRVGRLDDALTRLQEALAILDRHPELSSDGQFLVSLYRRLGLTHLLLAEDENCLLNHTATSCILPVREGAVHQRPQHARQAGDFFLRMLELDSTNINARWLLNLTRMLTGDYPEMVPPAIRVPAEALPLTAGEPSWNEIGWALGINPVDLSGGAIMDDFDGDGLLDLVSSSWDPCEPLKAFRNDGQGGFENVSAAWGLDSQLGGLNLVQADFDADGRLDLMVLRGAWLGTDGRIRNSLLRNDLERDAGRFVDVTAAAGMAHPAYPTQTAGWSDFDRDGDLDVFIGNEATASSTNPLSLFGEGGNAYPSQLFRNNGDGTFTDIARQAGVQNRRYCKGATWGDYDDDGDPDLYLSNIGPNRLYRNNGDGTFTDVAPDLGVVEPARGSFPTWFFDFDNDGDLDLFAARFQTPVPDVLGHYFGRPNPAGNPVLHLNEGGVFRDISAEVGLDQPLLVMGANFGDFDNDGFLDLYLGTGVPDLDALMPNIAYRNAGGARFDDITYESGLGQLQKGHGVAFGDLDNDGQQELFHQLGGAFPFDTYGNVLFENPGNEHRWITLRLRAAAYNTFAIGARVEVRVREGDVERSIHRLVGAGGSFGGSSLQQEIGLGLADRIVHIVIVWPGSQTRQQFDSVEMNRIYQAVEGEDDLTAVSLPHIQLGADRQHHHSENP